MRVIQSSVGLVLDESVVLLCTCTTSSCWFLVHHAVPSPENLRKRALRLRGGLDILKIYINI